MKGRRLYCNSVTQRLNFILVNIASKFTLVVSDDMFIHQSEGRHVVTYVETRINASTFVKVPVALD